MKKLAIAGASAVIAALPVVGVFAATSTVTDEIEITIAKECAITTTATQADQGIGDGTKTTQKYSANAQPGELKYLAGAENTGATGTAGSTVNVVCNDTDTSGTTLNWTLSAQGGDFSGNEGAFVPSTVLAAQHLASTNDIPTGDAVSGADSAWAMMVTVKENAGITQSNFGSYTNVPSALTTVATGKGTVTAAFVPSYRVYIGTAQQADTYVGHVTYTLSQPGA